MSAKVGRNSRPKKGGTFPPKKGGTFPPILSKALKSPTPYRVKGQASVKYLNKHRQIYYITLCISGIKKPDYRCSSINRAKCRVLCCNTSTRLLYYALNRSFQGFLPLNAMLRPKRSSRCVTCQGQTDRIGFIWTW